MKKVLTLIVAGVLSFGLVQSWAGGSCCMSKKKDAASCMDQMSSLNLTEDQKAKISDIEAQCKAEADNKEACAKYKAQIRDVLTEEQRTQFDAMAKKGEEHGAGAEKTAE